ncbi:MAG: cation efflux protein, CzcI family [Cupriavidus necator]
MRRLFLILLVVILPFQFSWAAAAAYCQHETAPAVWHIGHHEHHHKADAKLEKDKKSVVDSDCGICHLASLPFARADMPGTPAVLRVELVSRLGDPAFTSLNARAPDRPQWQRLA